MEYILIDLSEQASRLNGGTMWRLTFYSIDDGTVHEMTVDSTYRNFARQGWDQVVVSPNPWAVYTGLRRTRRVTRQGTPVITADSHPCIVYQCSDHAEALRLAEMDIDSRNQHNTFGELFEVNRD